MNRPDITPEAAANLANRLRKMATDWGGYNHLSGPEALHAVANLLDPPQAWEGYEEIQRIEDATRAKYGLPPLLTPRQPEPVQPVASRRVRLEEEREFWKVIGTDNFARENYADHLKAEKLTKAEAEALADKLNEGADDYSPTYYKAVPQDHKLWGGTAEFM